MIQPCLYKGRHKADYSVLYQMLPSGVDRFWLVSSANTSIPGRRPAFIKYRMPVYMQTAVSAADVPGDAASAAFTW